MISSMTATVSGDPGRPTTSATERRIVDAALRLFVAKGTTELTVSELAAEADVARGTLYRYVDSMETLFDRVVAHFSAELHQRVSDSFDSIEDPAARLATGVRMWIRYAHENPGMGRFAVRYGQTAETLRSVLAGPTMRDLETGFARGRFMCDASMVSSIAALIIGATISAMWMVLEGHQTWREAGAATAELLLRALGVEPAEAHEISRIPLPDLRPA